MATLLVSVVGIISVLLLYAWDAQHSGTNLRPVQGTKPVSTDRLEAFMGHAEASEPVHILVYRKYNFAWPSCWMTSRDDADRAFDEVVSQVLGSVGGALVARTKPILANIPGVEEGDGWYVSMYGLPNRSSYLRFLDSSEYKDARRKLTSCFRTDFESIAIANWVDYRVNHRTDCAWKPWGFDPSAPYPWPTSVEQQVLNAVLSMEDDGYPIQVWNVDQYKPGRAHEIGGPENYSQGAIKASQKMGMIHAFRSMCPDNICETQPLEGDFLNGINSVIIIEYPSLRALMRMTNDPDFDGSLKKIDEGPFVKNADVMSRVISDEVPVTVPSPFGMPETPPLATNCEDPAYISARKGETAINADNRVCDVDLMLNDTDRCILAVLDGRCVDDEGESCAEWLLGPGSVCTQALRYTVPAILPEDTMDLRTAGLLNTAMDNGVWDLCLSMRTR